MTHITIGGHRYEISRYYVTPFNQLRVEVATTGSTRLPLVDRVTLEGPKLALKRKVKLPFHLVRDKQTVITVLELPAEHPEPLEFPKQEFPNNFTGHH